MNRPTILNYEFVKEKFESKFNYELYTQELEKYCDVLEKALDKACKCIDDIHSCPFDAFDFEVKGGCENMCKERTENSSLCWKEWLLKDGSY